MTTRHSIRCLAAAALLLAAPASSRADDLLDTVLRDDYPATSPVTLQLPARPPANAQPSEPIPAPATVSEAPAGLPAAAVREQHPAIPAAPAISDAREPVAVETDAEDSTTTPSSFPRTKHSRAPANGRTVPKRSFDRMLTDAFAGCCFFVRPAPPQKRPSDDEDAPTEEYLP